ncbi:hypothetical protein CA13_02810 [Planctomycetes bacterium CA13]|uniref:Uncharacterized protein n=1 Tax=Novipirellula herctigrandis TaxID=2527986 RepID=A0A5C5YV38_9BACT|nr:hypothetical protein CA13_02810 [Planctomycetes bacterium CA13]
MAGGLCVGPLTSSFVSKLLIASLFAHCELSRSEWQLQTKRIPITDIDAEDAS